MSDAPDERSPYRTIRELAADERPRERLLSHGPGVLSDAELVAILLGSGTSGENVVDLSRSLLERLGGLAGLARADAKALQRTRGLGPARAAQLAAAIEVARRLPRVGSDARPLLTTPEAVYAFMSGQLLGLANEQLFALPLDTKGRLLGAPAPVLQGSINGVAVRPAEIFREAIVLKATSIVLVHNHPSGDPRPSPQDVTVTRSLVEAGNHLEIGVVDHLIIGQGRFVSLVREGHLK